MKALLFSFFILIGFSAHAGLMIEPYIGYNFGDFKYQTKGSSKEYSDTTTGSVFGGRLGYKMLIPWIAFDYSTGSGTRAADSSSSNSDRDQNYTNMAGVVGADLPIIGLRVFGGYGFSTAVTFKGVNGGKDNKYKGTFTKAGLGYTIIPFVAINAEYIINKYTKYDNGTSEGDVDASFTTLDHNTVLVSLSVPFSL